MSTYADRYLPLINAPNATDGLAAYNALEADLITALSLPEASVRDLIVRDLSVLMIFFDERVRDRMAAWYGAEAPILSQTFPRSNGAIAFLTRLFTEDTKLTLPLA